MKYGIWKVEHNRLANGSGGGGGEGGGEEAETKDDS